MAWQRTQVAFILKHVLIIGEDASKLNVFPSVLPLFLSNMLLAIRGFGYLICS
jgi:hypothetical protein